MLLFCKMTEKAQVLLHFVYWIYFLDSTRQMLNCKEINLVLVSSFKAADAFQLRKTYRSKLVKNTQPEQK